MKARLGRRGNVFWTSRRLRLTLVGLATLAVALGLVVGALANLSTLSGDTADAPPSPPPETAVPLARVTVLPDGPALRVPPSFLGFSTEYWTLPYWEQHPDVVQRVISLVHVPGDPPFVLRIGGDSADRALWEPGRQESPEWAFELDPQWLGQTRSLIMQTGVRVILDLNLITATPHIAAAWAQAAAAALPPNRLIGFEIGNEPDIYSRVDWLSHLKGVAGARAMIPISISAAEYARQYLAYARALASVDPTVPLLGPAVANPTRHLSFIAVLLRAVHPRLGEVTAHRYPYSACSFPGTRGYPTIARVLSERASAGMARALEPGIALAHQAGLPFRLTELNSVTCGGRIGVSNTFATALWAPDALFELIRAGVDGADVHVRETTVNAAFAITAQGLMAHPLLYGLILFAHALGPDAALVPARVQASRTVHLKAWAVRVRGDVMHILLIDKGPSPVRVSLHLPGAGPAAVQRLVASSVISTRGVTLGGQWLTAGGAWQGRASRETLRPTRGGYQLTLARESAALIVAPLRPSVARGRTTSRRANVLTSPLTPLASTPRCILPIRRGRSRRHPPRSSVVGRCG
jgi:hypothetical protein